MSNFRFLNKYDSIQLNIEIDSWNQIWWQIYDDLSNSEVKKGRILKLIEIL